MQGSTIDFMGQRKFAMGFSILTALISVFAFIYYGFVLGLDFTGGTLVEISYGKPIHIQEVRKTLGDSRFKEAIVQPYGGQEILVRIAPEKKLDSHHISEQLVQVLGKNRPDVQLRRVEFVGPQVGSALAEQGFLAVLFALGCIFVYVTIRFDSRLALGAIVALLHDIFLTLGVLAVFKIEFDLTVLAAILAILGYSLNDTIVVYDRIRENFRKMRKGAPEQIVNTALNEMLRRTLMTGIATILVLLALYFMGGKALHGFTVALLLGVFFGTYSSIYVASALALLMGIKRQHLMSAVKPEGGMLEGV